MPTMTYAAFKQHLSSPFDQQREISDAMLSVQRFVSKTMALGVVDVPTISQVTHPSGASLTCSHPKCSRDIYCE